MTNQTLTNELTFFTSSEVADILKMHPQVIARKLQAGEIEGYKLGKDWRVSKEQLLRYLERHSNQKTAKTPEDKVVGAFLEDGKLKAIPAARSKRLHVLKHLVSNSMPARSTPKSRSMISSSPITPISARFVAS